ncbi:MAG: hypothetical protein AAF763_08225 [Pseudomonadota bacterium]
MLDGLARLLDGVFGDAHPERLAIGRAGPAPVEEDVGERDRVRADASSPGRVAVALCGAAIHEIVRSNLVVHPDETARPSDIVKVHYAGILHALAAERQVAAAGNAEVGCDRLQP